jgi:hypothetical protein
MNERIRQLAEQAGFMEAWFSESGDDCEREIKKFAELIVKECVRVAKLTEADDGDDYKSGRQWAGIDLLKHFGVDE